MVPDRDQGSGPPVQGSRLSSGAVLVGLLLFVLLQVVPRYEPYTFIRRDGSFYATITMGLVRGFSLDQRRFQPQSWYSGKHPGYADLDMYWSNVSVGRHGAWYPKHSFLVSIAAAPFYAVAGVPGLLIFNVLCVIGMLWAAYLIAARFAAPTAGAVAVLLTAASPMLVEHTYHLSADVFNAALVAFGALALCAARPATAGALLGLALWSRPVTAGLIVPVTAALVWRRFDRRQLMRLGVAAAVPLAAAALANTIMYGAPWITSYDRILTVQGRVPRLDTARALFTNPLADGWRLMFESREHGLKANALPSLVALLGLVPLWRRSRLLATALAVGMIGFLAAYLRYRYFNARFFFSWEVLLCVPLAVLISDLAGAALWAAGAARPPVGRAWQRVRALPRWVIAAAAILVAGGAVVSRVIAARTYVLSAHVPEAKVLRNDFPCDYFNVTHQAWECSRLDRQEQELAGLSLAPRTCSFPGLDRTLVTLAPPAEGGVRRMRFEHLPAGALELDYGVREGAPVGACIAVSYGGRPAERLCPGRAGELLHRSFEAPAPGAPRELELAVDGHGPRVACFDGTIHQGR
jgi:hypothetical protein